MIHLPVSTVSIILRRCTVVTECKQQEILLWPHGWPRFQVKYLPVCIIFSSFSSFSFFQGILVQEIDEGRPCLSCGDNCSGFRPHQWR